MGNSSKKGRVQMPSGQFSAGTLRFPHRELPREIND